MGNLIPFKGFNNFVLRTPFFPISFIEELITSKSIFFKDFELLFRNTVVKEAIYISSPSLYFELTKLFEGKNFNEKETEKLSFSFMKYLLRMSSRCTPYGLYAGNSMGSWSETNDIILSEQIRYIKHTRPDMDYLCLLLFNLLKHKEISSSLLYFPNSSIYQIGSRIRYVEFGYKEGHRVYQTVAVDYSDYLIKILVYCKNGAYQHELIKLLTDEDIKESEATDFIDELINSQILFSELDLGVTGVEPIEYVLSVMDKYPLQVEFKNIFINLRNQLSKIDLLPPGKSILLYEDLSEQMKLKVLSDKIKYNFQVDMVKPVQYCNLNPSILNDVLSGLEILNKLSPASSKNNMSEFIKSFYNRYEEEEIPLSIALDIESGIGYKGYSNDSGDINPFIDDLSISVDGPNESQIPWNPIQSFYLKKIIEALQNNSSAVVINDEDLKDLPCKWDDIPDTISVIAKVFFNQANENDYSIYISGAGGSSAANLFGRFCHSDQEINKFTREITDKENMLNPNVILAEIVHLPDDRLGNILLRPVLRDYEIPYLSGSGVKIENRIPISDLYISVRANKIILRSRSLNKVILPRLTTAHNYSYRSLPVYRFLCDLQNQGMRPGIGFSWGVLAHEFDYLPRAKYKNIILHFATWNVNNKEIDSFHKITDENELFDKFNLWLLKRKIPNRVLLSEADNELLFDFNNVFLIRLFLDEVKNKPGFQLTEFPFNSNNLFVKGKEGYFTNEFIFSFYKQK